MATKRLAATAALLAILAAPASAQLAGRATAVQPDALQAIGPVGQPVSVGDEILKQARVYTKQYGTMEIKLEDGTMLTVAPNASLVIDDYVFAGPSRPGRLALSLARGAMRVASGRMPSEAVAINTPTATIGVRGTAFWLDAAPDAVRIWVTEGTVTAAPTGTAETYAFDAPAFATCSATGCERGDAPALPTVNPLGGGGSAGIGGAGEDLDERDDFHEGLF